MGDGDGFTVDVDVAKGESISRLILSRTQCFVYQWMSALHLWKR